MAFHRLVLPVYPFTPAPLLPAGYDWVNNLPASPAQAPADSAKVGGVFNGSYFIDFGEDAISNYGNRAHKALAENTDYLDDILNSSVPRVTKTDGVAAVPTGSVVLAGDIFVGELGTPPTSESARRLISVVNSVTGNELVSTTGTPIYVDRIEDGLGASVIGSSWFMNPTVFFNTNLPAGTNYRLMHSVRSSYKEIVVSGPLLSGFVYSTIRSAHSVPGEVVKFLVEGTRRDVALELKAFQTTLIETPTLGNPLYGAGPNTLDVHVDAQNVHATGGKFRISFDAGGSYPLSLVENNGAGRLTHLATTESTFRFYDPNIATMSTPNPIPLSSNTAGQGDAYLRVLEVDPTTIGPIPSIFQQVNARWTVTVGDGVKTFGDYNGINAINDVLTDCVALNVLRHLVILVKEGTYNGFAVNPSTLFELRIEGVGELGFCHIDLAATIDATVGNAPKVVFRNLSFGSVGPATLGTFSRGVVLEDCVLTNLGVALLASVSSELTLCRITRCSIRPSTVPAIWFQAAAGVVCEGILVEDSFVEMQGKVPVLRTTLPVPGVATIQNIRFHRCTLRLFGASIVANNPDQNVGVWEPTYPVLGATMQVTNIEWRDCAVLANWTLAENASILLLVPVNDAAMLSWTRVIQFTIDGGTWSCPRQNTTLTPFYIGPVPYNMGGSETAVSQVSIRNLRWGFPAAGGAGYVQPNQIHGRFPTFLGGPGGSPFMVVAEYVELKEVTFLSNHGQPGNLLAAGAFMCYNAHYVGVDGLYLMHWTNDLVGTMPPTQLSFHKAFGTYTGRIQRVEVEGSAALAGSMLATTYLMQVYAFTEVGYCSFYNFPGPNVIGLWESDIWVHHCDIRNVAAGYGIYCTKDATVENLRITDCTITSCARGINLTTTPTPALVPTTIRDCYIANNTIKSCTGYGINILPDRWSPPPGISVDMGNISVCNNVVVKNDLNGVQISFGTNAANRRCGTMRGVVTGNVCGQVGALVNQLGEIHFFYNAVGDLPVGVLGAETHYTVPGAGGALNWSVVGGGMIGYTTGNNMFRNYARLRMNDIP
jgi:hypothetical protein